jgi:hypothetical protein
MTVKIALLLLVTLFISCKETVKNSTPKQAELIGTWKLISGTTIEKGDTVTTDYTRNTSFIKVINDTHFTFLQHDLKKGKALPAVFAAGGGKYSLSNGNYTEHLEYCTDRNWEGNDFKFTISIKNDTLIQEGIEEVASAGIKRLNIEKYVRVNK